MYPTLNSLSESIEPGGPSNCTSSGRVPSVGADVASSVGVASAVGGDSSVGGVVSSVPPDSAVLSDYVHVLYAQEQ